MSGESVRRALAGGFQRLRVPEGFQGGVAPAPQRGVTPSPVVVDGTPLREGADEDVVADAAARLSVRFDDALRRYRDTKASLLSEGKVTPEVAEFRAQRELDEMADLVRRSAIESKGGAVIADMASALSGLGAADSASLSMVMRRAGNPEVFEPLLNAELPDVPMDSSSRQKAKNQLALDHAAATAEVNANSRDKLPLIYRPSSSFALPDSVGDDGKIIRGADAWGDRWKPKNHSIDDVPTQRIIQDKETGEWREYDPKYDLGRENEAQYVAGADSTRHTLLRRLAGDQIDQITAIEGTATKPTGRTATLPKKVAKPGEAKITEDTITVGAGESGQDQWSGRKSRPIDSVVDTASRGDSDRVFEVLERAARTGGAVDIDFVAPYARARIAERGPDGKLQYPNALPSPEYIAGLIIGWHGYPYKYYDKFVDVIRRSYDKWPDYAPNEVAAAWEGRVLIPSKSFDSAMAGGVGSKDYPHKIYGPRQLPRPEVQAPSTEPLKAAPPSSKAEEQLRKMREAKEKYSKPGNKDVSSMNMASPLGGLLA